MHQGENNRDQIIMRGNSSSADFFVDGVRDDVQYYRDLYNLSRVEVLKGPNALMFGRGGARRRGQPRRQGGASSSRRYEASLQARHVWQQARDDRSRSSRRRHTRRSGSTACSRIQTAFATASV